MLRLVFGEESFLERNSELRVNYFLTVCWGVRPTLALICLYIIAYSHTNRIFRADLRVDFSSYLYISIIFMFTCFLKSFVLVYCNCFYYACIHVIVSLLLHVYNYIHARFRSFKTYLRFVFL